MVFAQAPEGDALASKFRGCVVNSTPLLKDSLLAAKTNASHAADEIAEADTYLSVDSGSASVAAEEQTQIAQTDIANDDAAQDRETLAEAFQLFNQLSAQLSESYFDLEQKVNALNLELLQANAETEHQAREKQRVRNRLDNLLDLLPGGVVVLDQNGCVSDCNPAAVELLGEPLKGMRWLDVISRCFSPRHDDGHEISLKDGRRVNIATRSLQEEPGQIILLTDLTETRKLQQQVSRQERLTAVGQMMSSLAHQLRTPLSAAMLYAGHLCETDLSEQQTRKFSQKIMSRLTHLERQVTDMLIFVKGDVKLTDKISVVDLRQEIEQAIEAPLTQAGVQCQIVGEPVALQLICNMQTIVGAVLNLVSNAIQASLTELDKQLVRIVISFDVLNSTANHDHADQLLRISVIDNGPGMDAETLKQVQEPFFTTKSQGTGLGLAVVRAVAQAHHGHFSIDTAPGHGTHAAILLPIFVDRSNNEPS